MSRRLLIVVTALCAMSCADGTSGDIAASGAGSMSPKGDSGQLRDVDWANQLFVTQIYDAHWNPDGMVDDASSNNCGPTCFAMLLDERGALPAKLTAEMAIDHSRAMMYPGYPQIDASQLPDDASLYEDGGLIFVDDDTHPVYFDQVEAAASIAQGIYNGGGEPVFGYSSSELDALLEVGGAAIAHGHITEQWRGRFPGDYGVSNSGPIPHFVLVLRASESGQVLVCDPMHKGGAVSIARADLQAFFQSPVNPYESATRVLGWQDAPGEDSPDAERE